MHAVRQYDERSILDRVAKGDTAAFEALYLQYRDKIIWFGWKFLQSDAKAEDVLQEVFLKVWTRREELSQIRNLKAWLTAITRNHIYNALRRLTLEEKFIKELSHTGEVAEQAMAPDRLSLNDLQQALDMAVAGLTSQQKKVFELSRFDGLRHEQIAEELDISRDTVKKHMTDALRKIRGQMSSHKELAHLGLLLILFRL